MDAHLWELFIQLAKEKGLDCAWQADSVRRDVEWFLRAFVGKLAFGEEAQTRVQMERDKQLKVALRLLPAAEELEQTGRLTRERYKPLLTEK
ncbi:MAG: hypothetical protein KatS3mg026_0215 [Bacteroidia bacterium]|nr:MAG: hypothetical protein KatS3mg026_0215 [Bacteroidia bacterium]